MKTQATTLPPGADTTAAHDPQEPPGPFTISRCRLSTGITVEYVAQGAEAGHPVILLHGLTDSWRSFEPLLPHLPPDIRAYAVSLRGHGGSDRPDTGYAMRDMAADVVAFMDAMHIDTATLVGHSMGARVAMRAAIDRPERTRALVQLGAFAPGLPSRSLDELKAAVDVLAAGDVPAFAREFQEGTIARPVAPGFVDTMIGESMLLPVATWRAALDGLLADDASRQLAGLNLPVLLVWGTRDAFVTRLDQDTLYAGCPRARLEVHEGAGHALHWEDPARVAADLTAFIGSTVDTQEYGPG